MKADFHSHTCHSPDALTTPRELVRRARIAGLDRIAVTDHGAIAGALEAREIDPELVIVGEEIRSLEFTEVIGLYLTSRIPQGLPFAETVQRIHDQGGLAYAPHPFAYPWRAAAHAARSLALVDGAEAVNGRAFWPAWNWRARTAIAERGLGLGVGSDAHFPWEIGRAYAVVPDFHDATSLKAAWTTATPVWHRRTSPFIHVASVTVMTGKGLRGLLSGRPSADD